MADDTQTPAWNFWSPLSFGKVLLIFLIANVVCQLLGVVLREGLGLGLITASVAGGGGAVAAILIINVMARKRRA